MNSLRGKRISEDINDEHLEQGISMGESTSIHIDIVQETVQECVPGPVGTDVNTKYLVAKPIANCRNA